MKHPTVRYEHDKHRGHIVCMHMLDLIEQDLDIDAVIEWLTAQAGSKRLAYNMWKFRSQNEAEECIIMYNLTWTTV
jgi:hypothetical protein